MDFSLQSFKDAFRNAEYSVRKAKFSAFAFILATPADRNVFPELLIHLAELHRLTGDHILVVAPRIEMGKAPGMQMDAEEISRVLSSRRFYNHWSREYVDVSERVEGFLHDQMTQAYDFAAFIGLDVNEIPCVVFFDTLESPERYIRWSLQGTSASDVIKDFRTIVAALEDAKANNDKPKALDVIHNLDRKRFALKVLRELGKAVPILTSFVGK